MHVTERPQAANIKFNNPVIKFPNFTGRPTKYAPKGGVRSFKVELDDDLAKQLDEEGWNVQWPKKEEYSPMLEVFVNYDYSKQFPIDIRMVQEGASPVKLDEESCYMIDSAEIIRSKIVVRPRPWQDDDGSWAIKAYLKDMKFEIPADIFSEDDEW